MMKQTLTLFLIITTQTIHANILSGVLKKVEKLVPDTDEALDFTKKYLHDYGYSSSRFSTPKKFEENLIRMQTFAGIKVTGKVDAATISLMKTPRCGLSDPVIKVSRRKRRYVLHNSQWRKNVLTWYLKNTSRLLSKSQVLKILREAFKKWSDVTNIEFVEKQSNENIDIDVFFGTSNHGDPYPFDGKGGTLAHAFYPGDNKGLNGDIHFDDDEDFTIGTTQGRNLLWVATHEIGHSLGLEHSNVRDAIMYPWYTGFKETKLTYDDISGIQQRYGSKVTTTTTAATTTKPTTTTTTTTTSTTTTTTTTPTTTTRTTTTTTTLTTTTTTTPTTTTTTTTPKSTPVKKGCPLTGIVLSFYNPLTKQDVILTKDDKVFTLTHKDGITSGPFDVNSYFPFLPKSKDYEYRYTGYYRKRVSKNNKLSAAFTMKGLNGNTHSTILFAGESFYVVDTSTLGTSNVKARKYSIHNKNNPLKLNLPKRVKYINGAMKWEKTKRIYLFTGTKYWRYDSRWQRYIEIPIRRNFRGVPRHFDSVYHSDETGVTYFTSKNRFYKFSFNWLSVIRGYPKSIFTELYKCGYEKKYGGYGKSHGKGRGKGRGKESRTNFIQKILKAFKNIKFGAGL